MPVKDREIGRPEPLPVKRQQAIAGAWLEQAFASYPDPTARFLREERDRFCNPVGRALAETLPALLDQLLGTMETTAITPLLDRIVRIRAVQEGSPSQALAMIVRLRALLAEERRRGPDVEALALAESRVDELVLRAFDLYVRCREELYQIRAHDARRRALVLERMHARLGGGAL